MQEVAFDERYEDIQIYSHKLDINAAFWVMDAKDNLKGTAISNVGVYAAAFTDIPNYKELTTDIIIILRNQSDYSNVIILVGTFSVHALFDRIGAPRMLLKLTEYLFKKAETFAKETSLKGKDDKDFSMPKFGYSDDCFNGMVKE